MVKIAPIVLAAVIFAASCAQGVEMDPAQVDKVIVYGIAPGTEFSHNMQSIDDVIRNGRDTVITDRRTIKSLVYEMNHLRPSREQRTHDFRTALIFIGNNSESRIALLGKKSGIQFEGDNMRDRASLFKLVEEQIYGTQQNSYWLDDYSRSIIRLSSQAKNSANQVFEYIKRSNETDSLLLASVPTDFTDFSMMCMDLSVMLYHMGIGPEKGGANLLLTRLFNSQFIDYKLFVKKVTILSSTAYLPSSDAGSELQQVIRRLLKTHTSEIVETLNQLPEDKYKKFWEFYFHGFSKQERNREEEGLKKLFEKSPIRRDEDTQNS